MMSANRMHGAAGITRIVDDILGLAPTRTLKRHVTGLEASSTARFRADPAPARFAASRSSTTPPKPGAGSAASSPASGPAATVPMALHRHHPRPRQRPFPLPAPLLPARPGGKSHRGLETH